VFFILEFMAHIRPIRDVPSEPIPLHTHALDNLRYIRETMERAGSFTAVPGWGGVLMGVTALAAAGIASHAGSRGIWLAIWLGEALVAMGVGVLAMWRKARAAGLPLWSAPARKFIFSFVPPLFAGAVLTLALWQAGAVASIPGLWLMLYGTGVITGGAFSGSMQRVLEATGNPRLDKPFHADRLRELVDDVLDGPPIPIDGPLPGTNVENHSVAAAPSSPGTRVSARRGSLSPAAHPKRRDRSMRH